jgi:hypothetical protein
MKQLIIICTSLFFACSAPQTEIIGSWGDKSGNSSMTVSEDMATLQFPCANAEIPSALPNHLSAFSKSGTYTVEHGTIYEGHDSSKDIKEALFSFRFDGNDLTLTITDIADNTSLGSYTYEYDVYVKIGKCQ